MPSETAPSELFADLSSHINHTQPSTIISTCLQEVGEEILPEEYGGTNGTVADLVEFWREEVPRWAVIGWCGSRDHSGHLWLVQARGLPPAADPLQDGRGQEAGRQTQDPGRPLRLLLRHVRSCEVTWGHVRSFEVMWRVTTLSHSDTSSHSTRDTYFGDVVTQGPVTQFMTSAAKCDHCAATWHVTAAWQFVTRQTVSAPIALRSQFLCYKLYNCYMATVRNISRYTRRYY